MKTLKSSSSQLEKEQVANLAHGAMARSLKNLVPGITDEAIKVHASKDFFTAQVNYPSVKSGNTVMQEVALSPFQQKYYDKLILLLNEDGTTLELILTKISDLERDIQQNAPDKTEVELLFYATSVARHSAQYWHEKGLEWALMINAEICEITALASVDIETQTKGHVVTGMEPGYYPHPTDRTKFYIVTEEGLIIEMDCPVGLHFNPTRCVCDFPENFDGGGGFDWGDLVGVDVGGALIGAATGSFVGGVGAGPGALIGGSASSIGNAIGQLWPW